MLLLSLDAETIKTLFPFSHYSRGEEYFHRGLVQNLEISHNGENIVAHVAGSRPKPYTVKIFLSGSQKNPNIRGLCTCPMVLNCKHVVAALFQALNQVAVGFSKPQRDPRVDQWLRVLNQTLTEEKRERLVDESACLLYVLQLTPYQPVVLQIKLFLVKRLKKGGYGSPREFKVTQYVHQKHFYPVDFDLLTKLEMASKVNASDYFSYEKLIIEMMATGRCHWVSVSNPPLQFSKSKKAELKWQIDEKGFQEFHYFIPDGVFTIFPIDNLWYVNQTTWECGQVETGLDNEVAKLLLSSPKIPPEQIEDVTDILLKNEKKTRTLPRPTVFKENKTERIKPIPCLHLFQKLLTVPGNYKSNWTTQTISKPLAELTFDYRGKIIAWDASGESVNQIDHETLIKFARDKKTELTSLELLEDYELELVGDKVEMAYLNPNFTSYFLLENEFCDPLDFSLYGVPALREKGWRVEIDADYPYQIVNEPIEDWYSSIQEENESPNYNWFNLELGITLKGEKINLLPVLQQLLKKQRATGGLDPANMETVYAKLPDGRFIPLPAERIKNILNVLIELYNTDSLTDGEQLRLDKLHAARLLELEAAMGASQLRWLGGERLRALGKKLAEFKGIDSVVVPREFHGQLRPYQEEGLNWLQFLREYEFGGILADDMGLGKTIQALAHLTLEKQSGRMDTPSLVIAPTSLMFNWRMEAEKFAPGLKVLVLHGSDRKQQFSQIATYDLILTTYPLVVRDKEILLKQPFHLLILDEAQCVKNSKSLAAQIVQQIHAKHRLCLTGTPLENHLGELWSLFHFMMPGLLGGEKEFNRLFRTPIEKHGDQERRVHLTRRIAPFLLRRTKDKVVKELPAKIETIHHVELDGAQRDLYETIRVTMQEKIRKEIAKLGLARSHIIILDALLKLRQICCDPRLLKIKVDKKNIQQSAKFELLMTMLPELLEDGRRILLFSQFTEMLGLIEQELDKRNIKYLKLTGQTKDRATPVRRFQEGEVPLFLISLKAGGTGLNLTAADTVIHYDPWWNPAVENQATDRAHRIGQSKTVFVYKLVVKGTVEEKILEMQKHKRALMDGLFSETTASKVKLTEKDLQDLFEPLDQ